MSHELTETLVEPLTRLGLTVERAGLSLRVAVDLERIMTVTPNAEGVVFCHQLSAEAGAQELPARLNRLNRESDFARYVLRPTGVWAECTLPFAGRSLAPNQLHVACGELDAAIRRYHRSEAQPDDHGAAPLVARTLANGWTAIIQATSPERLAALDDLLWTYDDQSFVAHGSARDGDAALHPVWLTLENDNPNTASARFFVDGADAVVALADEAARPKERAIIMFDGRDEDALNRARMQFRQLREQGFALSYWRQNDEGRWEKSA